MEGEWKTIIVRNFKMFEDQSLGLQADLQQFSFVNFGNCARIIANSVHKMN